ncbi:MAG: aminomethyltransferase beta-barrel domain-containing protein, partial [Actinomycetes bacterium]
VVGTKDLLAVSTIVGEKPIWCGTPPVFDISLRGFAQIRAHGAALACSYIATETSITAILDEPLLGLATGQGLVIFDGDRVVGSATVSATE